MKILGLFFALSIGCSTTTFAKQPRFASQYVKTVQVRILSSDKKGVVKQETLPSTPKTYCFSQKFYCILEDGHCICDLHRCGQLNDKKSYWMEISGTEAEKYCGRSRFLHQLTQLCLCNPDKNPPCDECNPPSKGCSYHPREGLSLPQDCRAY